MVAAAPLALVVSVCVAALAAAALEAPVAVVVAVVLVVVVLYCWLKNTYPLELTAQASQLLTDLPVLKLHRLDQSNC